MARRFRKVSEYVGSLSERGRVHFTLEEAIVALGASGPAVRASLRRLVAKRALARPLRGFYVIVPPSERSKGCLPVESFVAELMEHLGEPYYVGLLSAAHLHGVPHTLQRCLQVMVRQSRRAIRCRGAPIEFVTRTGLDSASAVDTWVHPGGGKLPVRVASPETTALELVGYAELCGGLGHSASIIEELGRKLEPERLLAAARTSPVAWVQRLGYVLEFTDHGELAEVLEPLVVERAFVFTPLMRAIRKGTRVERWKLVVCSSIEPAMTEAG